MSSCKGLTAGLCLPAPLAVLQCGVSSLIGCRYI